MLRSQMIDQVSAFIKNKNLDHPLRVAIDGIDAAGKSRLAKELIFPLRRTGRQIMIISLDSFLLPSEIRYKRGRQSPEGYYYDSFNYPLLLNDVLIPLSPGGNRKIRKLNMDNTFENKSLTETEEVDNNAIILFDGVFLMRPELFNYWDIKIFVDVNFEVAMERAVERDISKFESPQHIRKMYESRYFEGQKIYFERCHPQTIADIILDNNNPREPSIFIQRPVA